MSADPKKIDAIKSATAPQNAGELRSLLGLANYVSRFIPDFATIVAPLRTLTHQNTTWQWGKKEQSAFKELKEKLSSEVMAYFNPAKSTKLLVDASGTRRRSDSGRENHIIRKQGAIRCGKEVFTDRKGSVGQSMGN